MSFTAKLHIQGVGCYVPLHETQNKKVAEEDAKRLLVIFPDGTPRNNPPGLCLHLNFVQFSNAAYAKGLGLGTELEGYGTRFLNRELLTVNTGGRGGPLSVDLNLVPKIEHALPDSPTADRLVENKLLVPKDKDGRVMGKLEVDTGSVKSNSNHKSKWYFKAGEERSYSNVVTVKYTNITQFELEFRRLVRPQQEEPGVQSRIPLKPPGDGDELEVWVRNICDAIPVEEMVKEQHPAVDPGDTYIEVVIDRLGIKEKINLGKIETDEDFVLNYKVRGSDSEAQGPVPKLAPDVGGEPHKCLGSK